MNKQYRIWLDTTFRRCGSCFRTYPKLNISPEIIEDLEKARDETLDESIKEKLREFYKLTRKR